MRRLCEEGMAAAEAARVVLSRRRGPRTPSKAATDLYVAAVASLVDAADRFDVDAFEEQVRRLPLLGSATSVLDHVVAPTLHEVGRRWHDGELSIAQERMASQRLSTFLRDMLRLSANGDGQDRVVLACFPDDEHELGLLGTAIRLAGWGYQPVYLGARIPPSAVRSAVLAVRPALVALSSTLSPSRVRAREWAEEYAAACGEVPWIVGGAGVASIAEILSACGGLVAGDDPAVLAKLLRELRAARRR